MDEIGASSSIGYPQFSAVREFDGASPSNRSPWLGRRPRVSTEPRQATAPPGSGGVREFRRSLVRQPLPLARAASASFDGASPGNRSPWLGRRPRVSTEPRQATAPPGSGGVHEFRRSLARQPLPLARAASASFDGASSGNRSSRLGRRPRVSTEPRQATAPPGSGAVREFRRSLAKQPLPLARAPSASFDGASPSNGYP
jgi:hypothetical protein